MDLSNRREKVIKGLESCVLGKTQDCRACPYCFVDDCESELMHGALELLKAQEPVEPKIGGSADNCWWHTCGKCGEAIDYKDKYCRHCGRAVKWNV